MERHVCTAALLLLVIVGVMAGKVVEIGPAAKGEGETTLVDGDSFKFSDSTCKRIVFTCSGGSCADYETKFIKLATRSGDAVTGYDDAVQGFEMNADWRTAARKAFATVVGSGKTYETVQKFNEAKLGKDVSGTEFYLVSKGSCSTTGGKNTDFQIWAAAASRGSLLLVWAVCLLMTVMQFGKNSYE